MKTRHSPVPVVAIVSLLFVAGACISPTHIGDGTIDHVRTSPTLEGSFLSVSPGAAYVCLETEGTPGGTVLVYDASMNTLESPRPGVSVMAISDQDETAAAVVDGKVRLLHVPQLTKLADVPTPKGAFFDRNTRILPMPSGDFLFLSVQAGRPDLWVLSSSKRQFSKSGRTKLTTGILGAAIDARSGTLVLTGKNNELETFDLAKMKSTSLVKIPVTAVSRALVAADGRAFVGTMDAQLVPVDLSTGKAGQAVPLGGPGETYLAMSKDRRLVAAAVQDRESRRPPYATQLRLYRRDGAKLVQVASAFLDTSSELIDLVPIDRTETVVLSTIDELLSWRYRNKPYGR